jgi:antitoxin component of MazEF toxin-antitoxin module
MKTIELKVARIGNSRGVRLPAATLQRYRIGGVILMEERTEGILLHPKASLDNKLSWEDTAREMAISQEDWRDRDAATLDGLSDLPWKHQSKIVAEKHDSYGRKPRRKRRKHSTGGST